MFHEPECGHSHPELYGHLGKCRCDILRAAYKRGYDFGRFEEAERWQETAHLAKTLMREDAARGDALRREAKASTALDGQTIAIIPREDGEQA